MMPSPSLKSFVYSYDGAGGCHVGEYCTYGVVYFDHGGGGMQV